MTYATLGTLFLTMQKRGLGDILHVFTLYACTANIETNDIRRRAGQPNCQ